MRLKEGNRAWFISEPLWPNDFFTSGVRCALSILAKWPKMAIMTPNDLWVLEILVEPQKNTEHSVNFLTFSVFIELERKNLFNGNIASHRLWVRDQLKLSTDLWKSIKYLESRQLEKSDIIRDNRWNQSYFDIRKFQITSVRIEIFDINRKSFRYFEYSANRRKIARYVREVKKGRVYKKIF